MSTTKYPVVYAPVYIPNTPDCEYSVGEKKLSKSKIKYLAKTFQRYKIIDLQHEYTRRIAEGKKPIQRGEVIESYITQKPITLKGLDGKYRAYPIGTWIIGIKITDPTAMMLYEQGKLSGVSATAKKRKDADFIMAYVSAKSTNKIPKRILLSEIKDPVVFTVSLVQKPCVYGAKFCNKSCMIKNNKKLEDASMSIKDIIKEKLNIALDDVDLEKALAESQKSENEENEVKEQTETEEQTEVEPTEPETEENDEEGEEGEEEGEDEGEEEVILESQKSYVTREEASQLFKAGFESIRDELENVVEQNINESISALQESQKEALGYMTEDEVKGIFENEFQTFKTDFEKSLKERQEESIKQFSKSIETNIASTETRPEKHVKVGNKLFEGRDANGCKIRKGI